MRPHNTPPTTPARLTSVRFSQIRFRSPLLTEYLLLQVLRCFTSPRSPQHPINSGAGDQQQNWPGFPIQAPSDQSPLDDSPRHIAVHHAFHRPLVPRHPPNAQKNNTTKQYGPPEEQTLKQEQKTCITDTRTTIQKPTNQPNQQPKTHKSLRAGRPGPLSPKPDSAPSRKQPGHCSFVHTPIP